MFRIAAIALVALAAFDYFLLDGKYLGQLEGLTRSLIGFTVG